MNKNTVNVEQEIDVNEKASELAEKLRASKQEQPMWVSPLMALAVTEFINPILDNSSEWNSETANLIHNISEDICGFGLDHFVNGFLELAHAYTQTIDLKENQFDQNADLHINVIYLALEMGGIWKVLTDLQNKIAFTATYKLGQELEAKEGGDQ